MDLKLIKNLLNLISESEVNEVSIEEGDFKIKIKKAADVNSQAPAHVFAQQPAIPYPAVAPQVNPAEQPVPAEQPATEAPAEDAGNSKSVTVKSPIVGTFFRSPSPDSDPFVKDGDVVAKGDTLCIVEAMKIMNEIESEYSGKIVKILVEDNQPIEYDQPLFIIEPS